MFGFAYVPWSSRTSGSCPQEALPKTEQRVELFLSAVEAFTRSGLPAHRHGPLRAPVGRAGRRAGRAAYLCRNFQGYTVRPAVDTIAFGMTSISDIGGAYAQNAHRLKDWGDRVEAGTIPVERGVAMSDDDVMRRFVINRVMCLLRLDLKEVEEKFGAAARKAIEADLRAGAKELQDDGLVTFDGSLLRVTPLGQLLVRNVAMLFDAYLKKEGAKRQFSRTV